MANTNIIIDKATDCSFSSKEKKARSGTTLFFWDMATKPLKPIKKTIGIIIKNEIIKLLRKHNAKTGVNLESLIEDSSLSKLDEDNLDPIDEWDD